MAVRALMSSFPVRSGDALTGGLDPGYFVLTKEWSVRQGSHRFRQRT